MGHAIQNETYLTGLYERAYWLRFAKNHQNNDRNSGGHNWPKLFWVVYVLWSGFLVVTTCSA